MSETSAATTSDEQLFDAAFLSRLRALFFKLRKRRQLQKRGQQSTPAAGFTREFKDHRQYTAGDDYRAIDWRVYARLERLFIRIFEEVQEFHVHLLIDRSLSMAKPYSEKRVAALRLAVALAYLALMNQHRVSVMTMGEDIGRVMRPIKGAGYIHEVIKQLGQLSFDGQTDLERSFARFRPGNDRKGIVFVISDLLGRDPNRTPELLEQARLWPAETHIVQVLHPEERRPDLTGELRLVDVETGEMRRLQLTPRDLQRYTAAFEAFVNSVEQTCLRNQINYGPWPTDAAFEESFMTLLSRGSAMVEA